jgi:hypothetical protein
VPIFLNLRKFVHGGTYDNITLIIIFSLVIFGGMPKANIANKVVCFELNGVTIFQGLKTSVIIRMNNKHCIFLVRIYCMAHQYNLDIYYFLDVILH